MSNVKVSIVIPVYNVENYIKQCLDSVISQTLKEIEIIIVNDCSKQNEDVIIKEYMKKDSRIIYIKNDSNVGLGETRNIGFSKASGEYFGCVDSDDYVDPTMFEKLYRKAKMFDADIAMCDIYRVSQTSEIVPSAIYPNCFTVDKAYTIENFENKFFSFWGSAWLRLYKRNFFKKYIKYPKGVKHEDVMPYFTGMIKAQNIVIVGEPLYYYRVKRPGAITSCVTHTNDVLLFLRGVIDLFKDNYLYDKYKADIFNFICSVYYWYDDKPEPYYNGIREILLKEYTDEKFKNKRIKMFLNLTYEQKERKKRLYKIVASILPLKFIQRKLKIYQ